MTITTSITSTESVSKETTIEVGTEIESGVLFSGASVSVSVSRSLAETFETSETQEVSRQLSCDIVEDGSNFVSGCMWQFNVDVFSATSARADIFWKAPFVRCTADDEPPKCPPFQRCANTECTLCVDIGDIA